ncbi:hypothetical protein SDRG_17067, partial [Saprolegnia diclina VS20]
MDQQPTTTSYEIHPAPTVKHVTADGVELNTNNTNNLVLGEWTVGIFGCFTDVIPNCCMAFWCPCVSLAQIVHRIGLGAYTTGLFAFGLAYLVVYITAGVSGRYPFSGVASGCAAVACGLSVMIVRINVRTKL